MTRRRERQEVVVCATRVRTKNFTPCSRTADCCTFPLFLSSNSFAKHTLALHHFTSPLPLFPPPSPVFPIQPSYHPQLTIEATHPSRLLEETDIKETSRDYIDGPNVIDLEDIELVFPGSSMSRTPTLCQTADGLEPEQVSIWMPTRITHQRQYGV